MRGEVMGGIKFNYMGNDGRLVAAIGYATALLQSVNFRQIIENREKPFFNTQRSCEEIAKLIFECDATIRIKMFSKKPRFGRITTAEVKPRVRDTIFFNTYAIGRGDRSNTNTLVHEAVHVVDRFHDLNTVFDFTHKGNRSHKPPENQDSAPYWIGNRSEDLQPLLSNNQKSRKRIRSLDDLNDDVIKAAITERNWAEDEHSSCGTR